MKEEQLYFFNSNKDKEAVDKRRRISLPVDTFILLGIIIGLLFILLFSVGVEKGKRIAYRDLKNRQRLLEDNQAITQNLAVKTESVAIKLPSTSVIEVAKDEKNNPSAGTNVPERIGATEVAQQNEGRYRIQVASYIDETSAQKLAKELKDKGYLTTLKKSNKYIAVYVSGFPDEKKANYAFEELKKKYKDCILRRL
jgi:cell division septation protein DedD